ncbi:MAG TPA: DNA topoisomerase VI subunit B [Thermoprotei archaeon]|nr:DNA topoisomerase VI subunit B [Thermoprotei archaeon]
MSSVILRSDFKGLSPAEFFYRNREIAGFSNPVRALYQTIRELLENSLDATELYGILPTIEIDIKIDEEHSDRVIITVKDNGIGVPIEHVPYVFGSVFYGSKYDLKQSRGIFGLGIKMAVLYSQLTTGKPIFVRSSTPDSPIVHEEEIMIDISKNMPIIVSQRIFKKRRKEHGTEVRITIEGNWAMAKRRVEEYVRRTAMIAPYAEIRLRGPDLELEFKRSTRILPNPPRLGKPHPYGVDIELLKMLISDCDANMTLKEFLLKKFEGTGERTIATFLRWSKLNGNAKVKKLSIKDLDQLSKAMRGFSKWRRPRPIPLSPLGEKLLKEGVKKILKPEYISAVTRKASSYSGHPFIVEVAIAYGGEIPVVDKPILYRFANKIPLLYDEGVDVARKVVDSIDWGYYKVKFPAPLAVIVHICSTKIPFKGVGKEAVADVPEVEREIANAIKDCARRLRRHISYIEKIHEIKRRKITILKYLPEVTRALNEITGVSEKTIKEKLIAILEKDLKSRGEAKIGKEAKAKSV